MTCTWSPTGLIPWFSKTEGNTYTTLLHHPFLFKGKLMQFSRGSKKDFWRRCRGGLRKVKSRFGLPTTSDFWRRCRGGLRKSQHTKYPSQTHLPRITLFAICLSFSSPPLHPCRFIRPLFSVRLFFACLLCACVLDCLSQWLKIILNCVTFPIPTTMILLALRLLLLPMLNLVKLIPLC